MKNHSKEITQTTTSKQAPVLKIPLNSQRLRQARIATGMTLEEISPLVSINKMTLQRYESGDIRTIAPERLNRLAEFYNTTPGWLHGLSAEAEFFDEDTGFHIVPVKADLPTATGKRLLSCLNYFGKQKKS